MTWFSCDASTNWQYIISCLSPFLSIIVSVQMVGHLMVHDGTVLIHIKHWDFITGVLSFSVRCKDLFCEGPHLIIGLCQAQQRFILLTEMHSAPIITMQHLTKQAVAMRRATNRISWALTYAAWIWRNKGTYITCTCVVYMTKDWLSHYKSSTPVWSHAHRGTTAM